MQKSNIPAAWAMHDLKLRPYRWSHRVTGWGNSLVGLGFIAALIFTPLGAHWLNWSRTIAGERFLQWLVFLGSVTFAGKLLSLPFSIVHHQIERKYEQSKQSFGSWASDQVKGLILVAVLGSIALGIMYLCMAGAGENWWLPCAILFILFTIVLAQLAPVLFLPLFFKMEPMPAGDLKERLYALCRKFDVRVEEIYHLGLGDKTEKGNAAFMGLGRTKRIVIGDTIYKKYPPEEVEAVFAHELGHQVHNDLWKGIALSSVLMILSFSLANSILLKWVLPHYQMEIGSVASAFFFFIVLSVVQIPIGVFQAWYSRSREWAADRFAVEKTGTGPVLASALETLTYQNLGQFTPNALWEFLTYSHPAPGRRIRRLRGI